MRISVNQDDKGYGQNMVAEFYQDIKILFNGNEIFNVITADDEEGIVEVFRSENQFVKGSKLVFDCVKDDVPRDVLYGKVVILRVES